MTGPAWRPTLGEALAAYRFARAVGFSRLGAFQIAWDWWRMT